MGALRPRRTAPRASLRAFRVSSAGEGGSSEQEELFELLRVQTADAKLREDADKARRQKCFTTVLTHLLNDALIAL